MSSPDALERYGPSVALVVGIAVLIATPLVLPGPAVADGPEYRYTAVELEPGDDGVTATYAQFDETGPVPTLEGVPCTDVEADQLCYLVEQLAEGERVEAVPVAGHSTPDPVFWNGTFYELTHTEGDDPAMRLAPWDDGEALAHLASEPRRFGAPPTLTDAERRAIENGTVRTTDPRAVRTGRVYDHEGSYYAFELTGRFALDAWDVWPPRLLTAAGYLFGIGLIAGGYRVKN
ncbi:hypothetical protein [Halovivax limisalsi]|uniref:hypothetical protein n=1 Tax=Halovivax limisalsi TaxID=1453760 RepID=UPI001FFC3E94|nr:hypothetical protein [Halovivax limisalsi]